jgi:hypothetical protein
MASKSKFMANRRISSYIPWMNRPNVLRLALAGTMLSIALPFALHASEPGPVTPHPTTPADTLTKLEKTKQERTAPASKKKLKGRQAAPSPTTRSEFMPDQPWETEFYVENDVSGRVAMQIAFASFTPRH